MLYEFIAGNIGAVVLLVTLLLLTWYLLRLPRDLPPGPFPLPIIGNLLGFIRDPEARHSELRKQYGDVYSVYMGSQLCVMVHGYDNIRELLVTKGDVFADRPPSILTGKDGTGGGGIVMTNGLMWHENRKFTLSALRDFGFGKRSIEQNIQNEVHVLLECMGKNGQSPFNPRILLQTSMCNVLCSMVFGTQFAHDDPVFNECFTILDEYFRILRTAGLVFAIPILRFIPFDPLKYHKTMKYMGYFLKLINKFYDEHSETYDVENIRDFHDAYYKEMKLRHESGRDTIMNEKQLKYTVGDLFIAGTESTSTVLRWGILYLCKYPEIQRRVQAEISDVVGEDRLPSLDDRTKMPYTEATLMEMHRFSSLSPMGAPRAPSQDTMFHNYRIPKGTTVLAMVRGVHYDEAIWGDPQVFRPERFLDENGKVVKKEELIPFGLGKRVCPGEVMSKMEQFLFMTAMLQRFTFRFPEGTPEPPLKGVVGITLSPHPFEIIAEKRGTMETTV